MFATATEDMDALTFGTRVLLRHLTFSEARKMPVKELHLEQVLQGLEMNQAEVSRDNCITMYNCITIQFRLWRHDGIVIEMVMSSLSYFLSVVGSNPHMQQQVVR